MDWVKDFYHKQTEWLGLPDRWLKAAVGTREGRGFNRAEAISRLSGPGPKRVLELGCGSGLVSAAIACAGHDVTAIDIIPERAAHAERLIERVSPERLEVVCMDFYEFDRQGEYDVVCYFDGFGIGSDNDQRRLLHCIREWLKPDGCALIDIYSPFLERTGQVHEDFDAYGRTSFDPATCRLLNSIWRKDADESDAVTQSLRCYSPPDLRLLLEHTGLTLQAIEPYANADHETIVPIEQAMFYLAKLASP